ncbi:hypothetical protein M23134_00531 [Microscilla marina ATCC 23134]|uniref:Uncharacterized protein n=1 Tax=Microscilla marina ATCC 23134 TaxID=313606 RepID=A1ZJB1_MICM2|nr:hypothetical protein M23134_00531 [Microscilla marina ATCC 23134]
MVKLHVGGYSYHLLSTSFLVSAHPQSTKQKDEFLHYFNC